MKESLSQNALLPMVGVIIVSLMAGASVSGSIVSAIARDRLQSAVNETSVARARIALLENVLKMQSANADSIDRPVASTAPVVSPALPVVAKPVAAAVVARPEGKDKPKVQAQAVVANNIKKPISPPAVPSPVIGAQHQEAAPKAASVIAVTPDMVVAAKKSNKIEGVDGVKLGVSKLNSQAVYLKNGKVVPIGGVFQSGERLLELDAENGQIVTDKRTILVF